MITKIKSDFAFNVYLNGDLVGKSNNNAFSFNVPFGRQVLSFEFADDTTRYARAINILQIDASNDSDTFVINLSLQDDKIIQTFQQEKSLPPQTPNTADKNENTGESQRNSTDSNIFSDIFSSKGRMKRAKYIKLSAINFGLLVLTFIIEILFNFEVEAAMFRQYAGIVMLIIISIDILIANRLNNIDTPKHIIIFLITFTFLGYVLTFFSTSLLFLAANIQGFLSPVTTSIITLIVVVQILNNNKRLHDLGRSGWWQLLCFVLCPILCFIYTGLRSAENPWGMIIICLLPFIWLLAAKGDDSDNKYGPVV